MKISKDTFSQVKLEPPCSSQKLGCGRPKAAELSRAGLRPAAAERERERLMVLMVVKNIARPWSCETSRSLGSQKALAPNAGMEVYHFKKIITQRLAVY